jgi:hypothetical protein
LVLPSTFFVELHDSGLTVNITNQSITGSATATRTDYATQPITSDEVADGGISFDNLAPDVQYLISSLHGGGSNITNVYQTTNGTTVLAGVGLSGTTSNNALTLAVNSGQTTSVVSNNLEVKLSTGVVTSTLNSGSGLERTSSGLQLIGGCSSGQILAWTGSGWACTNAASGGGSVAVDEGGVTVTPTASAIDFSGSDFTVVDSSGTATIAIDYASSGIARISAAEAVTGNWSFKDSGFTLTNSTDSTKKAQFDLSGVATATTRTFSVPDANGTLITTGNLNNITGTGALTSGSIGSGFGTISTANNIGTSAALQGGSLSVASGAFAVNSSGAVTAATGITSSGTIQFNGLASAGVVHTNGSGQLSTGAVVLGTDTSGAYVQSLGTATGLTVGGTASVPTLSVIYGSSANQAAQGNTALTFTGSGNLTGSLSGTAGGGFTTTTLAVSATPNFTSVTAPTFTNANNLALSATGASHNLTLSAGGSIIISGFNCSTFDNGGALTTNASGVLQCSNDDGGAAGTITGSGTVGRLAAYSGTGSLSDSALNQNGAVLELDSGNDFSLLGGNLNVAGNLVAGGSVQFSGFTAGVLRSDGSGNVSTGAVALGTDTTGAYVQSVAAANASLSVGGTASNPTLSVSYGTGANQAAAGSTSLSFTGSGNLTGTVSGTAGGGFSTNTLAVVSSPTFSGTVTAATFSGNLSGNVTGNVTGALTGNASTATALAVNPTDCSANSFATSIDAGGNLSCANVNLGTAAVTGNLLASNLQNAAADLGNADITVDLTNSHAGRVTNLILDGALTVGSVNGATITSTAFNGVTIGSGTVAANLTGNVNGNVTGALTGNASTATALAANPSDCSANQFATTIAASGNLGCVALAANNLPSAAADLGAANVSIDLSNTNGAFVTNLTTDGSVSAGSLSVGGSSVITSGGVLQNVTANTNILTSGVLGVARGGTGLASYTTGDLLYASGATTIASLSDVATGSCLISGGVGVAPQWGSCAAGGGITGSGTTNTLPLFNSSGVLGDSWLSQSGSTLQLTSGKNLNLASGTVTATTFNGNLSGNVTGNITGALTGNASTATALAVNPTDCSANSFATTIDAGGNLSCVSLAANNLPSAAADLGNADVTIDLSNSHAGRNTNLTLDGTLTLGSTLNGLTISSGALSGVTGITFTSGNLALGGGNITGVGSVTATTFNGNLSGNVTGNVTGALTGNASTATALAADPSDCAANTFAQSIVASGALTCAAIAANNLPSAAANLGAANISIDLGNTNGAFVTNLTTDGTITAATFSGNLSGNVTGNVTGALTGNASTATALAANPSDCAANTFAQSIVASGNLTCASVNVGSADITGNLLATNLQNAASDLGDADITVILSNSHAGRVTNLTTDGTITAATFSGNLSGNVTGNVTGALTGNASTATALAANPADCSANQFATTIAASGALTCAAIAANNLPSAAADLGAADVTINLGNTNASFNTNLTIDGGLSVGGSTVITSADVLQNVTANTSILTAGTLGVARGGTGAGSFTSNGVLYGNGTSALQVTAAGTSAQVLLANGSGVPTFTTISGDVTVSATGTTAIQADSVALATDTTGNYIATLTASSTSGLTVTGSGSENGAATVTVKLSATSTNSTTSTASGLELTTNGLQLLGGCTNGQILKYNGTNWACAADSTGLSDSRLKTNVANVGGVLNDIKNLRVVTYNFDCLNGLLTSLKLDCAAHTGIISQEVQSIFPGVITQNGQGYYEVNFQELQFYTLRAVVQLASMIDDSGNASLNSISTSGTTRLTSGGALQNISGLTGSGALTIASGGSGNLTLSSASGVLGVSSGTGTIQRVASGTTTLDLNDTLSTTLSLVNNGIAGTASLDLNDGGLKTNGTQRLSNGGALQNITGLAITSGGASIAGGLSLTGSGLNLNSNGITSAGTIAGLSGLSGTGSISIDLANLLNDTLTITNSLTGVAGLSVEGGISAGSNSTVSGTLSGISTLTATTVNATSGFQNNGTNGIDASCSTSQYIGNSVVVSGGIITGGTCRNDASGLSDQRVKTDIVSLDTSALEAIKNVNAVNFSFDCSNSYFAESSTDCASGMQTGVVAQELATIFPNLVHSDDYGYYHVDYQGLSVYTLKAVSTLAQFIDSAGNADFSSLAVSGNTLLGGGLTVNGDATFNGHTAFDNAVSFADAVDFNGPVTFNGQTHFNTNTGGYAVVHTGQATVHVNFAQAYDTAPIVSVTPGNGQATAYSTNNVTTTGFDIVLPTAASSDHQFSWIALSVLNPAISAQ